MGPFYIRTMLIIELKKDYTKNVDVDGRTTLLY